MGILYILLAILKILAIVALSIIGVIFVLLIIMLISPISYNLKCQKYDSISVEGSIKLFIGALKILFSFNNDSGFILKIKLFFKTVIDSSLEEQKEPKKAKKPKKEKTKKKTENVQKPNEAIETVTTVETENDNLVAASIDSDGKDDVIRVKISEIEKEVPSEPKIRKIAYKERKKEYDEEHSKTEETPQKEVAQKIDAQYFIKMPFKEKKALISAIKRFIKRMFKIIKPKKLIIIGKYGLSDPALTGEIYGAISVISAFTKYKIEVIPEFGENVFEGKIEVQGKILPVSILYSSVRLLFEKPIFKIVKIFLKG